MVRTAGSAKILPPVMLQHAVYGNEMNERMAGKRGADPDIDAAETVSRGTKDLFMNELIERPEQGIIVTLG